jgi:hypothetical protein
MLFSYAVASGGEKCLLQWTDRILKTSCVGRKDFYKKDELRTYDI